MKLRTLLLASSVLLLLACDSGDPSNSAEASEPSGTTEQEAVEPAPAETEQAAEAPAEHEHGEGDDHEHPAAPGGAEFVEIAADGSRFDPAVEKPSIPGGTWICDMGTVHYARPDQGDGKCPICNMNLVQHN